MGYPSDNEPKKVKGGNTKTCVYGNEGGAGTNWAHGAVGKGASDLPKADWSAYKGEGFPCNTKGHGYTCTGSTSLSCRHMNDFKSNKQSAWGVRSDNGGGFGEGKGLNGKEHMLQLGMGQNGWGGTIQGGSRWNTASLTGIEQAFSKSGPGIQNGLELAIDGVCLKNTGVHCGGSTNVMTALNGAGSCIDNCDLPEKSSNLAIPQCQHWLPCGSSNRQRTSDNDSDEKCESP